MSDERYPRPWRMEGLHLIDAKGGAVVWGDYPTTIEGACLAALVGAVNAADRTLPLETVLANLAAGKV